MIHCVDIDDRRFLLTLTARHAPNPSCCKTDVADTAWIAQLLERRLVRPSFVQRETQHLGDLRTHRAELTGATVSLPELPGVAGVLPEPALIRIAEPTRASGHWAAAELLDLSDPPTALACFNDKAAVGALAAAHERGLRVPRDLSIAGFDDIDLAQATTPALTTVRQPLREMGRMAVSLLNRLLEGHELDALHLELATDLVVRESTGPLPEVH